MKLSSIFVLFSVSFIVSSKGSLFDDFSGYIDDFLEEDDKEKNLYENVSEECLTQLKSSSEFKECFMDVNSISNLDAFKKSCEIYTSDKCLEFYANPLLYVPKCTYDEKMSHILNNYMDDKFVIASFFTLNGEGNPCPIVEGSYNKGQLTEEQVWNSCKSKTCYNSALSLFKRSLNLVDTAAIIDPTIQVNGTKRVMNQMIDILESDKCISQIKDDIQDSHLVCKKAEPKAEEEEEEDPKNNINEEIKDSDNNNNENNENNGANAIKILNSLIVTLALVIYYFI